MNKAEFIKAVAEKAGFTQKDVRAVVEAQQEVIYATISTEEVKIVDGVTLTTDERAARKGRNPQTGATMEIPAKKVPKCKFGAKIKDIVAEA